MVCRAGARGAHHQVMFSPIGISRHGAAEAIPQSLTPQGSKQRTVTAGIHVRVADILCFTFLAGRSHDDVGMTVAVHIAGARDVIAEEFVTTVRSKPA